LQIRAFLTVALTTVRARQQAERGDPALPRPHWTQGASICLAHLRAPLRSRNTPH